MTHASAPPRVGLVGVDRTGSHLLEKFSSGGPLRIVAVWDESPERTRLAESLGVNAVAKLETLATSFDLDVLWITRSMVFSNANLIARCLKLGKHVIVESPLDLSLADAKRAFNEARARDLRLLVHCPRRDEESFRRAVSVAASGELGTIRAAKFVSWGYGRWPNRVGDQSSQRDPEDLPGTTVIRLMAHALDQLLHLIPQHPHRAFATAQVNPFKNPSAAPPQPAAALALSIEFANGTWAELDLRLDSPVPFHSGWVLTGNRGGFADAQRYSLTDEREVLDSPVTPGEAELDSFAWLAQQLRAPEHNAVEDARAVTVVVLLDAARRSLESRQVIEL